MERAYEQLAGAIRAKILSGELAEGERMPSEVALAREAHVSRSTVREALRMLQEAGLLERASPKSLIVGSPDRDVQLGGMEDELRRQNVTFQDLVIALLAIEPELTRLATLRLDSAGLTRLEENLHSQERNLGQFNVWSKLDDDFHVTIAQISANAPLLFARRPISQLLSSTLWRFLRNEEMTRAALQFHHRILDEMRAGDGEAAAFMARKHIRDFSLAWERSGLPPDLAVGDLAPGASARVGA